MSGLRFWWAWFKLGRAYWSHRHLWTLLKWMESLESQQGVGDEMEAWLHQQEES